MEREPRTIQDKLIAGLVALGYERLPRRPRYEVFKRDDIRHWYVGKSGALRIGRNVSLSIPANGAIRYYVLTAPQIRPIVFRLLDLTPPPDGADLLSFATGLAQHPTLLGIPERAILAHIRAWTGLTETAGVSRETGPSGGPIK